MAKPTAHCSRPWCEMGPHQNDHAHYAPVADFTAKNADVSITISEHQPTGGPQVTVSLHLAGEEGGLHLDFLPSDAHGIAEVLAALDPAAVLQFAERLAFAAVTLAPDLAGGGGRG